MISVIMSNRYREEEKLEKTEEASTETNTSALEAEKVEKVEPTSNEEILAENKS